jgi:hypothetical protein
MLLLRHKPNKRSLRRAEEGVKSGWNPMKKRAFSSRQGRPFSHPAAESSYTPCRARGGEIFEMIYRWAFVHPSFAPGGARTSLHADFPRLPPWAKGLQPCKQGSILLLHPDPTLAPQKTRRFRWGYSLTPSGLELFCFPASILRAWALAKNASLGHNSPNHGTVHKRLP